MHIILVAVFIILIFAAKFLKRTGLFLGSSGLMDAIKSTSSEAQNSPRQLQNLTQTYAGLIRRDFPEFDPVPFLTRAENTLVCILNSLEEGRITQDCFLSDNLRSKLSGMIADIQSKGVKWRFDDILVHKSCISSYRSLAGSKIIGVQIALQYKHLVYRDNELIFGNGQLGQYKYQIDAVYIQDVSKLGDLSMKGHNCPNCGAPVTQTGAGKACTYCRTGLKEVNVRIWAFDNYKRC